MRYVITGAARGLGLEVAQRLRTDGHQVYGVVRPGSPTLPWLDGQAEAELTELDSLRSVLQPFANTLGAVDGLVHSAGVVRGGAFDQTSAADLTAQFTINVTAVAEVTQVFLPGLRAANGMVLLLNSASGLHARTPLGGYGASKFALRSYADTLRLEEPRVRVSSIYPGRVATDMQRDVRALEGAEFVASDYLRVETVAATVITMLMLPTDGVITDLTIRPWPPEAE